jgi:hypothetical protein
MDRPFCCFLGNHGSRSALDVNDPSPQAEQQQPLADPADGHPSAELVTGVTASTCVRTTVCDAMAEGFRPPAVRECIGDRIAGAVAWSRFDLDAKFGDVESADRCVAYALSAGRQWSGTRSRWCRMQLRSPNASRWV